MTRERLGFLGRWVLYRQTIRRLSQLDDWLLADIGLDRETARSRARRALIGGEDN